jgi:hypothetical protein
MRGQIGHFINYKNEKPKIGMGATVFHYTDRSAATVERISKSGKVVWLREDRAVRLDKYGQSETQSYMFEPIAYGKLFRASKRKDGQWRISNDDRKVVLGVRDAYHDYSF